MKEEDIQLLPEALPPVYPPAARRRFSLSTEALPGRIPEDEIRRILPSHTRAFLNYRVKRPRRPHARGYTVCVI
jgi:hypothetical protein